MASPRPAMTNEQKILAALARIESKLDDTERRVKAVQQDVNRVLLWNAKWRYFQLAYTVATLREGQAPCRRLLLLPSNCEMPGNPQRLRVSSFGPPLTVQVFVLSHYPDSRLLSCLLRKRRQTRILRSTTRRTASLFLNPSMLLARQPPTATPA